MIYLLGGRKNPAIRAIVGAVLLVAGIVIHGGAILIALGAVLIVWGLITAGTALRARQRAQADARGRMS